MSLIRGLTVLFLASLFGSVTALAQYTPATGLLDDDPTKRVRSDGRGIYVDGVDCVHVGLQTSDGFYQLRTVSNVFETPEGFPCNSQSWGVRRTLTLDFGVSVPDLDRLPLDGDSAVEDAPARLLVRKLFHKRAQTTEVSILVLTVLPETGATTQDTAWELRYLAEATIVRNEDGSREISLSGAAADAELLEHAPQTGRKHKPISHGVFNMPLHLRAAPLN